MKILMIFLLMSTPALAGNMPEFDNEAYCKGLAEAGGGSSMIELECRKMEADAKKQAAQKKVTEKMTAYCKNLATAGGDSYMVYNECLKMELDAAKQLGQ